MRKLILIRRKIRFH